MSADTISFSYNTSYDFTTSQSKSYGDKSNGDLGRGKYGMIAGDTNGDKIITVSDFNSINADILQSGYKSADQNMDGMVSDKDYNYVTSNLFEYTKVP